MRVPRQIVIAAVTATTVGSVASAVLPSQQDGGQSATPDRSYQRQYSQESTREREIQRLRGTGLQDAVNADELRSGEVRQADRAAGSVVRLLLRKP